jgi:hypothetical protein
VTGARVGSEAWLRRVFVEDTCPDIFGGWRPNRDDPLLVLLGGQPGAGKTSAQRAVLAANPQAGLVPVTGDDLREYHPDYALLAERFPLEMPAATGPVSGGLVRLALDHALTGRYSVLLEGTFRDTGMVAGAVDRFAAAGYRAEVVAVAAPAAVSRLATEQRALGGPWGGFGRWTPPDAHQAGLEGSPKTLAALEKLPAISRVQVWSRDRVLYDNTRRTDGMWRLESLAAEVLRAEQSRQLAPAEAAAWLGDYQQTFLDAVSRPGYLGVATIPTYELLEQDAANLIPVAATLPQVDADHLRREGAARRAALSREPHHQR